MSKKKIYIYISENKFDDQIQSSLCIKGPLSHRHWQLKSAYQQEELQWLWILREASFEKLPESTKWNIDEYMKKTSLKSTKN